MSRILSLSICSAASLWLLCSCSQSVPENAYRVAVEKVSRQPKSISRKYVIETASLRKIILAETSGANSVSIAPNSMTGEKTGKAEATVTVELQDRGDQARVTVKVVVKTDSITSRSEETLATPGTIDLASILTENEPVGDLTEKTTLLRLTSGEKYLQVVIE